MFKCSKILTIFIMILLLCSCKSTEKRKEEIRKVLNEKYDSVTYSNRYVQMITSEKYKNLRDDYSYSIFFNGSKTSKSSFIVENNKLVNLKHRQTKLTDRQFLYNEFKKIENYVLNIPPLLELMKQLLFIILQMKVIVLEIKF